MIKPTLDWIFLSLQVAILLLCKYTTKINTKLAEENAAAEAKLRRDEEKAEENTEVVVAKIEDERPRRSVAKVLAQYLETSSETTPACSNMIWYTMIAPCH